MPKRWSTKSPTVIEAATAATTGTAVFRFTDDYSVFHYSKMPDQIPAKGEALARMAAATMTMLAEAGIPTHFLGFAPPDRMKVRLLRIIDPAETALGPGDWSRLIPLQVICRNMLPQGASVFRRLASGAATLQDLGLDAPPAPNQRLERPLIEFTTKLEEIDRFVTPHEAQGLAGLDDGQFARLRDLTLQINRLVTRHADSVGLVHADSKVEFGFDDAGQVILVDTAGTLDENRFLYQGRHVSKQVLRDYYLPFGLEEEIQRWVDEKRARSTWPPPPRLPPRLIALVSDLYKSAAERWSGKAIWGAPDLETVTRRLQEFSATRPASVSPVS
jgi:phosphoribosylaminoimidazole-succinocarboxamide synthase